MCLSRDQRHLPHAQGKPTLVHFCCSLEVVGQVHAVDQLLQRFHCLSVQVAVLLHLVQGAGIGHLVVGQEEVLQLEQQRLAVNGGGCAAAVGRHGHVGVGLVLRVEEGSQRHVRLLTVLAVGSYTQELLHTLG